MRGDHIENAMGLYTRMQDAYRTLAFRTTIKADGSNGTHLVTRCSIPYRMRECYDIPFISLDDVKQARASFAEGRALWDSIKEQVRRIGNVGAGIDNMIGSIAPLLAAGNGDMNEEYQIVDLLETLLELILGIITIVSHPDLKRYETDDDDDDDDDEEGGARKKRAISGGTQAAATA